MIGKIVWNNFNHEISHVDFFIDQVVAEGRALRIQIKLFTFLVTLTFQVSYCQ